MRNSNIKTQTKKAVRHTRLSLGVSALCLLSAVAAARAQSASDLEPATEVYGLRGTTTTASSTQSDAASTLYGALPAASNLSGTGAGGGDSDDTGLVAADQLAQADANPDETETQAITGSIEAPSDLSQADEDYAESLARQNTRAGTVDGSPSNTQGDETAVPGFMIGSLTLRPTLGQRVTYETVDYGTSKTSRTYSETSLSGTLESNWSRHQFTVDGSGTWQKNLSGTGTELPSADLDAQLNLDLVNGVTATLGAGYGYAQESSTDANAVTDATTQSGIHTLRASVGLQKELGLLRGTTTLEATRTLYGDAILSDGTAFALGDRNTMGLDLTARVGYALSPALVPFLEASVGREKYDERVDRTGAERSSTTYAGRAGAEINLGEKLSGEFAAGYVLRELDDSSLRDLSGLTLDSELNWSPQRGTTVRLGVATSLESSTTAGESGAVVYELNSSLTQQVHRSVVARLGANASYTDYESGSSRSNQRSYGASAGLTWSINRYLDLEADASYQRIVEAGSTDEKTARIGLGLKLRR